MPKKGEFKDFSKSKHGCIYSAKHQDLDIRKVKNTYGSYVNNRGFKVLIPRYFNTAPDDVKEQMLKHEKVRREMMESKGKTKALKRMMEYSERGHDQFFGEGYTL